MLLGEYAKLQLQGGGSKNSLERCDQNGTSLIFTHQPYCTFTIRNIKCYIRICLDSGGFGGLQEQGTLLEELLGFMGLFSKGFIVQKSNPVLRVLIKWRAFRGMGRSPSKVVSFLIFKLPQSV